MKATYFLDMVIPVESTIRPVSRRKSILFILEMCRQHMHLLAPNNLRLLEWYIILL